MDKIYKITRRDVMRGIPCTFRKQQRSVLMYYPERRRVIQRLLEMDMETCSRREIDNLIGNDSWTHNDCNVCGHDSEILVHLVRNFAEYIDVCPSCLKKALSLVEGKEVKDG